MAQKIETTLTDDLDPDLEATGTVVFGLDGTVYEIDLTDEHATQMRDAVQPYVAAARKVGGARGARQAARPAAGTAGRASTSGTSGGDGPDPGAVRAWAREHGIAVNERGRIKGSVVTQFLEATR